MSLEYLAGAVKAHRATLKPMKKRKAWGLELRRRKEGRSSNGASRPLSGASSSCRLAMERPSWPS